MKLAIISHTRHYFNSDGQLVGWGPTVKEIDYISNIFKEIYHIAPVHPEEAPKSAISYKSDNVTFIALKPSGGQMLAKMSIILNCPENLRLIHRTIRNVDIIQFRAPTGIGIYVLPYLEFFCPKPYWVKYAGNWVGKDLPLGNRFQRWWLQSIVGSRTKITINGSWRNQKSNIKTFQNPTLTSEERIKGSNITRSKTIGDRINFCFVGALNKFKGVDKILDALDQISNLEKIGEFHFVGDGPDIEIFRRRASSINVHINFHGFLEKDEIVEIYEKCHFIVLASKSEGFPKVIAEGMNYGCIPVSSSVSCIDQFIVEGKNGFLILPNTSNKLSEILHECLKIERRKFKSVISENYKIADKFTYENYKKQLLSEIIE